MQLLRADQESFKDHEKNVWQMVNGSRKLPEASLEEFYSQLAKAFRHPEHAETMKKISEIHNAIQRV
jgi:hypothetical protein